MFRIFESVNESKKKNQKRKNREEWEKINEAVYYDDLAAPYARALQLVRVWMGYWSIKGIVELFITCRWTVVHGGCSVGLLAH